MLRVCEAAAGAFFFCFFREEALVGRVRWPFFFDTLCRNRKSRPYYHAGKVSRQPVISIALNSTSVPTTQDGSTCA